MLPTPAIGRWLRSCVLSARRLRLSARQKATASRPNRRTSRYSSASPATPPPAGPSIPHHARTYASPSSPADRSRSDPVMPRWTTSSRPSSSGSSRYLPRRAVPVIVAPSTSSAAVNFGWGNAHAAVTVRPTTNGSSCRRIVSTSGSSGNHHLPSYLHDHGDDHRSALGRLVDELAGGPADDLLQRLDVGAALGERLLDRVADLLGALGQQGLGLRGVDPTPGDHLGPGEDRTGRHVDRDHDHDHALLGQDTPVTQHAVTNVAD